MTNELKQLLELAREHTMTQEERDEQIKSFAYGNVAIENPRTTREMIDRAFEQLKRKESV